MPMTKPDITKYSTERLAEYHRFAHEQALNFSTCTLNGRMAWRRERDRVEREMQRRWDAA